MKKASHRCMALLIAISLILSLVFSVTAVAVNEGGTEAGALVHLIDLAGHVVKALGPEEEAILRPYRLADRQVVA